MDAQHEDGNSPKIWQRYSYDDLSSKPELLSEYDAMLAARPTLPSRIFCIVGVTFVVGSALVALIFDL